MSRFLVAMFVGGNNRAQRVSTSASAYSMARSPNGATGTAFGIHTGGKSPIMFVAPVAYTASGGTSCTIAWCRPYWGTPHAAALSRALGGSATARSPAAVAARDRVLAQYLKGWGKWRGFD